MEVEVPATAAVLDYVLSDKSQSAWDNHGRQDFHTAVEGALNERQLQRQVMKMLKVLFGLSRQRDITRYFVRACSFFHRTADPAMFLDFCDD